MGMAAAIIGAGALSAGGAIASSSIGSSAAKSAAKTQAQAAEDALAQQKATTAQVLGIEQPFVNVGSGAIPAYNDLLGIGADGKFSPGNMSDALAQTPGYQFALKQGLMATNNAQSSQGLGFSGSEVKAASQYAEGLAGTQYQNILNNYYNTLSLGSNAASNFGAAALGGQAAANQLTVGAGQAIASGTVGSANAITGGINGLTGNLGNSALLLGMNNNGLFGSSGGPAGGQVALNNASAGGYFTGSGPLG